LNLPLDLPHGHQRDDLLPLRGATARLRAERMRGGHQSQSVAISRNQSHSTALSRNQSQSEGSQRSACPACMPRVINRNLRAASDPRVLHACLE
jgi:hypothetical protein